MADGLRGFARWSACSAVLCQCRSRESLRMCVRVCVEERAYHVVSIKKGEERAGAKYIIKEQKIVLLCFILILLFPIFKNLCVWMFSLLGCFHHIRVCYPWRSEKAPDNWGLFFNGN